MMDEKRQNVLDAIAILTAQKGFPPTHGEIANFTGMSRMNAYHHFRELRRARLLTNEEGVTRTILLTDAGRARLSKVVIVDVQDSS